MASCSSTRGKRASRWYSDQAPEICERHILSDRQEREAETPNTDTLKERRNSTSKHRWVNPEPMSKRVSGLSTPLRWLRFPSARMEPNSNLDEEHSSPPFLSSVLTPGRCGSKRTATAPSAGGIAQKSSKIAKSRVADI